MNLFKALDMNSAVHLNWFSRLVKNDSGLKRPISSFLEVGFEKFLDSHL